MQILDRIHARRFLLIVLLLVSVWVGLLFSNGGLNDSNRPSNELQHKIADNSSETQKSSGISSALIDEEKAESTESAELDKSFIENNIEISLEEYENFISQQQSNPADTGDSIDIDNYAEYLQNKPFKYENVGEDLTHWDIDEYIQKSDLVATSVGEDLSHLSPEELLSYSLVADEGGKKINLGEDLSEQKIEKYHPSDKKPD